MPAKHGTFRITLFPGVAHSKETKEIQHLNDISFSDLVREAILHKAEGFQYPSNEEKPYYLTEEQWGTFKTAEKRGRSVDYTYYLALYWLKSQTEFEYTTLGSLVRQALVEYCN